MIHDLLPSINHFFQTFEWTLPDWPVVHDWLNLMIRWGHFIAGIMWVGTSFYFVWMDSSFERSSQPKKGIDGELWMVHGGNFYHVEKRKFGAGEMPPNLHWFIWEATLTWISGFILLIVVYYLTNGAYLVDPALNNISSYQATGIGLLAIFGSWIIYELLFRANLTPRVSNAVGLILAAGVITYLTNVLSGRGAFIHVGAVFGTIMVLNVWIHILPNQRAIITAANAGIEPDYSLGIKAKKRSMHNSYMTLPVLFIMISNHFSMTTTHPHNGIILTLIIVLGAFTRHFMITLKKWSLIPALASFLILVSMTSQKGVIPLQGPRPDDEPVSFLQIKSILRDRCLQCHSSRPSDDLFKTAPNGVKFDVSSEIKTWLPRIIDRACERQDMPLANKTKMTDAERTLLKAWYQQGASLAESAN